MREGTSKVLGKDRDGDKVTVPAPMIEDLTSIGICNGSALWW